MNQNIKPQGELGVTGIHEMTTEDLVDAPTFNQVAEQATVVLDRRHVLVFNAAFDRRVLKQTYGRYGLKLPTGCRWTCMQDLFSIYLSDWSGYWRDFRKHSYQAGLWDADEMGQHQYLEGMRRRVNFCARVSSTNEGARWIERITAENFPKATQSEDWLHAAEKKWHIAKHTFADKEQNPFPIIGIAGAVS